MQFFFYCNPDELKEVFAEVERQINIVYCIHRLNVTWVKDIDDLLRTPINSYREFHNFGQIYPGNDTGFFVYCPDDPAVGNYYPVILKFSGPPSSVADSRLIGEGSVYLEDKIASYLNIYKTIRRSISKRFKKVGYAYLSPSVYEKRHEVIFLQQNVNTLSSPWYMDDGDKLKPIRINDYYEAQGETLEQRRHHDWNIYFFAYKEDFVGICGEIEAAHDSKYIPCGQLRSQFSIQHSIYNVLNTKQYQIIPWMLYDETCRLLLAMKIRCPKEDSELIIESSQSWCYPNPFGVALYESFISRIKEQFHIVTAPGGELFYISPRIYQHRHQITFRVVEYDMRNFDFRIDANNNVIIL